MAKAREPQFFTVRNRDGAYAGCYRTLTAQQAIDRFLSEQAAYQTHFRGRLPNFDGLVARVEGQQ